MLGHNLTVLPPGAEHLAYNIPATALEETTSVHSVGNLGALASFESARSDSREDLTYPEGHRMSAPVADGNVLTTVIIENLPPDFDEDDLDVLVDNPNEGIEMDGSIISIDLDDNSRTATVNFSSPSGQ